MELTYKVRGPDGAEYGPATLDQLNAWLREGRVQPQSEVLRSDQNAWATAVSFPELSTAATGPAEVMNAPAPGNSSNDAATLAMKSGASWFYWIAALSLVNSIVAFTGSDWRFIINWALQIFDAIGHEISSGGKLSHSCSVDCRRRLCPLWRLRE
jgi:hypothetical protein